MCFCLEIKTTGNVILMFSDAFENWVLVWTPTCFLHRYMCVCVRKIRRCWLLHMQKDGANYSKKFCCWSSFFFLNIKTLFCPCNCLDFRNVHLDFFLSQTIMYCLIYSLVQLDHKKCPNSNACNKKVLYIYAYQCCKNLWWNIKNLQ